MSVDPYMRGRMIDRESYVPPFQIGEALQGGAVGQVVASNGNDKFKVGDFVQSMQRLARVVRLGRRGLQKLDAGLAPIQSYLGALGMPGLTAYAGLLRIGALKDGETRVRLGGVRRRRLDRLPDRQGQGLLRRRLRRSDEKARCLKDVGIDEAINYKTCGDLNAAVAKALSRRHRRLFRECRRRASGSGAQQHAAERPHSAVRHDRHVQRDRAAAGPAQPGDGDRAAPDAARLHRLQPLRHAAGLPSRHGQVGRGRQDEVARDRSSTASRTRPKAFIGLFKGDNLGKMVVRVGPDKAV